MAEYAITDRLIPIRTASLASYVVEVRYREPSYEARHGARPAPFRFRYRVLAADPASAVRAAVDEFRAVAAASSVGWTREIVGAEATRVTEG